MTRLHITARDVSVNVGAETIECAAVVDGARVRMRYIGYTARQAVRAFVRAVNAGEVMP